MNRDQQEAIAEAVASYDAAMTAAFQVLLRCLQNNGLLKPGQFHEALRAYIEATKDKTNPAKSAILSDLLKMTMDA
jgi:hypothetical protein